MIPKIIHYCWFGKKSKPSLVEKCIKSWKKYCPDYEIIEWNEQNFDISSAPLYVRQAYEAKKYAFVSDYVRLYVLVRHGGIYMDTDVEVIKSLDRVLENSAVSGFETDISISTGFMACNAGFPLFTEFLSYYDNAIFRNPDGTLNQTTNVVVWTNILLKNGFVPNGQKQSVEGLTLLPKDYFSPYNHNTGKLSKTGNTIAIHWFNKSWISPQQRVISSLTRPFHRVFGDNCFEFIKNKHNFN